MIIRLCSLTSRQEYLVLLVSGFPATEVRLFEIGAHGQPRFLWRESHARRTTAQVIEMLLIELWKDVRHATA